VARKPVGDHPRNTGPMMASARCGAKTRNGTPCRSPSVQGKERCRMHGGAKGSGAPIGNSNALKHGFFTRKAMSQRRVLNQILREFEADLRDFED
jgi:glucans biosynthesis protein